MSRRKSPAVVVAYAVLAILGGCERQSKEGAVGARATSTSSAADVVVKIDLDGRASVGGEPVTMDEFLVMLREKTERCPRDADGLPAISVEISAHPECEYERVQRPFLECMKTRVWRVRWKMEGKRLRANLAKLVPGYMKYYPPRGPWVKLYWANADGKVIHSPTQAIPPEVYDYGEGRSTEGAHLVVALGPIECADLEDLVGKLADRAARAPGTPILIDGRRKVPFKFVFRALEACLAAGVRDVEVEHPPIQNGDDWRFM